MKVTFDIDLEKFRYSLVGDGYILEEVVKMSQEELIRILKDRVTSHIRVGYSQSLRYGLLDGIRF